jgi:hypothetical protein
MGLADSYTSFQAVPDGKPSCVVKWLAVVTPTIKIVGVLLEEKLIIHFQSHFPSLWKLLFLRPTHHPLLPYTKYC